MLQEWYGASVPLITAVCALIVPGLVVLIAGWGRSPAGLLFAAPAVSTALLAVSSTIAPLVGLAWSILPLLVLTVIAAAVAFVLRRWAGPVDHEPRGRLATLAPVGAGVLAVLLIAGQLVWAFGRPDSISQTFDAIVHLNTAAFAVDTGNASAFHIGATSDIPFYPNAWHSLVALIATATGASVPVAVTAANIAIGAVAWPASCMALAAAFFRGRVAAVVAAAALSTGFGAFPMLLFYFGVLYPNVAAYAVLPAGVAVVVWLLRSTGTRSLTRWIVLLAVVSAGVGLAHPNAFLALYAFGASLTVIDLVRRAAGRRTRRAWITAASVSAALVVVAAVVWRFSRTNAAMSQWGPWQATAQSVGEAVLVTPRAYPLTILTAALVIAGLITVVRQPQRFTIAVPFGIAIVFFVLAAGTSVGNPLRELITNPWYNDPYRLAALLPVAAIPVAALGCVTVVDLVRAAIARRSVPRAVPAILAVIATGAVFSVAVGPNVLRVAADARGVYATTATSALLSVDEQALLERLDETTPADALIAGSPWTGTSLAYAIADRQVVEKHVFGSRNADEVYLDEHLRDIDTDPRVCQAIDALGVDYILDFGSQNVWNSPPASVDRAGIESLPASPALQLVDSEGPDAKLYRVVGCAS